MYVCARPIFLTLAALLSFWHVSCQSNESETFPWQEYKLPTDLIPLHYDIFIVPSMSRLYYTAEANLTLRATKHTDRLIYNGGYNERHTVHVYSPRENGNLTPDARVKYMARGKYDQHYVQFYPAARPGDILTAHVTFSGPIDDLEYGANYRDYTEFGEKRREISMLFFGLQEIPGLRTLRNYITHKLRVARETQHTCFTAMPLVRTTPYRQYSRLLDGPTEEELDTMVVDEFETSIPPFYVFLSIGQWANKTAYLNTGTPVRVFAPEDQIHMTDHFLETSMKSMDLYANFTGVPYPWPKIDLVPYVRTGGVSPRGLIYLEGPLRYFRKGVSPPSLEIIVAWYISHEMAHQWFPHFLYEDAGILGLSEGLAQYLSFEIQPKLINTTTDTQYRSRRDALIDKDSFLNTHAIGLTYDTIEDRPVFHVAYDKPAFVVKMLERVVGAEVVKEGFRLLFAPGPRQITRDDIWSSMQTVTNNSGIDVKSWMETWIQQAGFPLVTISRTGNQLRLTQIRYLRNQSYAEEAARYRWEIPFTYTSSAHPHETKLVWVRNATETLTLPDHVTWVIGNSDTWGIYRVNYDSQGWQALENQLMENHTIFSADNRINLIKDAFSFAWSGLLTYETALGLIRYLPRENDVKVRRAAVNELNKINRFLATDHSKKLMTKFMGALEKPKENANSTETTDVPAAEADTSSASGSVKELSDVDLFKQWKQNESTSIPPARLSSVFRAGCRLDRESWDVLFDRATKMRDETVRNVMVAELSLVPDVVCVKRLLDAPSVVGHMSIFSSAWSRVAKKTPRLFWRFLRQNFIPISTRYSASIGLSQLKTLIDQDDDYMPEVKTFFESNYPLSNRAVLEQMLEKLEERRAWPDRYSADVTAWLTDHGKVSMSA